MNKFWRDKYGWKPWVVITGILAGAVAIFMLLAVLVVRVSTDQYRSVRCYSGDTLIYHAENIEVLVMGNGDTIWVGGNRINAKCVLEK